MVNLPLVFLCMMIFISSISNSQAGFLELSVNKGMYSKYNMALAPFACELDERYICREIQNVVEADLARSGEFALKEYDKKELLRYSVSLSEGIDVVDIERNDFQINERFRVANNIRFPHSFMIVGRIAAANNILSDNDKVIFNFNLWDIIQDKIIIGKSVSLPVQDIRRMGHIVADMVYESITGNTGHFDTQIAYAAIVDNPGQRRTSKIAIMDQDGYNVRYLEDESDFCASPKLSPNVEKILYRRHVTGSVGVVYRDLSSGERYVISKQNDVYSAPNFMPDGDNIVMAKSTGSRTDIIRYNLSTGKKKSLTLKSSINTTPSYTHDGKRIVFSSDRNGTQQIYSMNRDGTDQQRISFGNGRYSSPDCSPNDAYVTFIKMVGNSTSVGVMNLDSTKEREVVLPESEHALLEKPTWAPNSQYIVFAEEDIYGKSRLRVVDAAGQHSYEIVTETYASDPAWSRKLPIAVVH